MGTLIQRTETVERCKAGLDWNKQSGRELPFFRAPLALLNCIHPELISCGLTCKLYASEK